MAYQQLEEFTGYPDAAAFLSRYNVAQLQACLYRAESMTVTATQDLKTIIRYAKLAKLLHEIIRGEGVPPLSNVARPSWPCSSEGQTPVPRRHRPNGPDTSQAGVQGRDALATSTYRITFTGPASVLRETRRYGVNFARFLPALLACKGWRMEAVVRTPWKTPAKLALSEADRFTSHLPPPEEFDSSLEQSLADKFGPTARRLATDPRGRYPPRASKNLRPGLHVPARGRHGGLPGDRRLLDAGVPGPQARDPAPVPPAQDSAGRAGKLRTRRRLDYRPRPGLQDDSEAPTPAGGPGSHARQKPAGSKEWVERHPTGHYGNR